MIEIGDIWCWTYNTEDHPDDPEYNYFLVLENKDGVRVLYLYDGRMTLYHGSSFTGNKDYLVKVA